MTRLAWIATTGALLALVVLIGARHRQDMTAAGLDSAVIPSMLSAPRFTPAANGEWPR